MKKFALTLIGALALGASTGFAQISEAPAIINRASVFYDLNTISPKYGDNAYFNGYGVGYNIDFRVSKTMPLYVGTGLDVRFLFHKDEIAANMDYDPIVTNVNSTLINLNLPVNVSYRVPVADKFFMTPFVGLNFRVQAYGNADLSYRVPANTPDDVIEALENSDTDINLFSSDDMGDAHLRRFQMGWQAGVNLEYNQVTLGLSFGTDFVKLHKNVGGSNFMVSLGYAF